MNRSPLHFTCTLLLSASLAHSASILFVSDNGGEGVAPNGNFAAPPFVGTADDSFVTLLQNGGHTITRYNPPNATNLPLSAADITQINGFDLIILGRSLGSGPFVPAAQAPSWNTQITKPILNTSAYLTRANRLGWTTGNTVPDDTPTTLTATDLSDPETAYIFGGVALNGNTTVNPYDEALERNTSQNQEGPVAGGNLIAIANFITQTGTGPVTGNVIYELPSGTLVLGLPLSGYRIHFAAGNREASLIPTAGADNLTADGENMFLRAVDVAVANGVIPEPTSLALLAFGGLVLARRRR